MNKVIGSVAGVGLIGLSIAGVACGDDAGSGGAGTTTSGATTTTSDTSSGTTSGTTTGTTASSTSTSTGDGGGGGMPDPCNPSDGVMVEANCGIFVDTNAADDGNGSQGSPFNSLALALAASDENNNRIYVCGALDEAAVVPGNRRIHGELDCSWVWNFAARTPWTAPSDLIPLRAEPDQAAVVVTGFPIEARDATAPQGSSIAIVVDGGALDLARVDITTGTAVSGIDGVDSFPGANGGNGSNATANSGGAGGTAPCVDGGDGATVVCTPMTCMAIAAQPNPGAGGDSFAVTCTVGDDGLDGANGLQGANGGQGSIGPSGFAPSDGANGTAGANGAVGGGGGAKIDSMNTAAAEAPQVAGRQLLPAARAEARRSRSCP